MASVALGNAGLSGLSTRVGYRRQIIDWLSNNWRDVLVPTVVGAFVLIAGLWLRQLLRAWLHKWSEETGWTGFEIVRQTTTVPSVIWALIIAAALAVTVSALPSRWERHASSGLWTLFVLSFGLFVLNMAGKLIRLYGQHLKAPERTIQIVLQSARLVIVIFTVFALLEVWGAPTTAIVVLLAIVILLALLALRDIGPDLLAGLQLSSSRHFKVGDYIRLKESDEEGYVTQTSWRNTLVRAANGSVSVIPNRKLIRSTIINYGHPVKKAKEPFHFYTRLHLKELTALKARTLKELVDILKTAPDSVIYYHTHHFLEEHHYLTPQPSNDLAIWVGESLGYEVVAESLASVDTYQFTSMQALRERHISIIDEYLSQRPYLREAAPGDEFHFVKSISVVIPTQYQASDLREFVEALRKLSPGSLYFHVFESRLRLGKGLNDFSAWLADSLGDEELARKIARIDPYTSTLEGLRTSLVQLIEKEMSETPGL